MRLKFYLLLLILKLTAARYANMMPKFYAQDSAIIVDTGKQLPPSFGIQRPYPLYRPVQSYPIYHIIKPTTTPRSTSTSTTAMPSLLHSSAGGSSMYTPDEFPADLLDIAQHKLGLKRLDEIPSISELGELLGTSGTEETIERIRQLTTTEQGTALIKAYIESTDYTNSVGDEQAAQQPEEGAMENEEEDNGDDDDDELEELNVEHKQIKQQTTKTLLEHTVNQKEAAQPNLTTLEAPKPPNPTPTLGFLERLYSYFNLYNLWTQKQPTEIESFTKVKTKINTAPPFPHTLDRVRLHKQHHFTPAFIPRKPLHIDLRRPYLVRPPLPYHFPIPLRPSLVPTPSAAPARTTSTPTPTPTIPTPTRPITPTSTTPSIVRTNSSIVYLNTPKAISPHVQNLLNVAAISIPAKKLEIFLQNKPKLAELAAKVSRFPLAYGKSAVIDAHLLAAVQKAIEYDDDLKELLNAAETLK